MASNKTLNTLLASAVALTLVGGTTEAMASTDMDHSHDKK